MLKFAVSCIALFLSTIANSQAIALTHPSTLGIHATLYNFKSPSPFKNLNGFDPGLSLSYTKGLRKNFDLQFGLHGAFPDSTAKNSSNTQGFMAQIDGSLRTRFPNISKAFQPFLLTGFGGSLHHQNVAPYILIAPGLQLRYKTIYFLLNGGYHASLSNNLNSHYYYSIGIAGLIGRPKKQKPQLTAVISITQPIIYDRDNDGTVDSVDNCPDVPGLMQLAGCPDSDNDGIPNNKDHCPQVFGSIQFSGCPFSDVDNDGVKDEDDHCPSVQGLLKYQGCPVPDKDGDGVNDEEDHCIDVPGLRTNNGCPLPDKDLVTKVDFAARNIYFKTGSFELLSKSFRALDDLARLLEGTPSLLLTIEGHTDNVGGAAANQLLSEKRAKSVVAYLVAEGIVNSRLTAIGYGLQKPIASNEKEEGRTKNRRVEIKVRQ